MQTVDQVHSWLVLGRGPCIEGRTGVFISVRCLLTGFSLTLRVLHDRFYPMVLVNLTSSKSKVQGTELTRETEAQHAVVGSNAEAGAH